MASFGNKEDIQGTIDAGTSSGGSNNLKFEEGNNYIIILDEEYEQGYDHWIHTKAKTFKRTCLADLSEKGWSPEGCPGCGLALEMYDLKKAANLEHDTKTAKEYNERGNKLRANYAAVMKAVKGKAVVERRKNPKTGKYVKKVVPDFEEMEVGMLRLSHSQMKKLLALVDDDNYPYVETETDLVGRILNFVKEKTSEDKKYAEVTRVIPAKKPFDIESLELDEEDIPDISEEFVTDDDFEEICELYRQELEEDEEEEYEEQDIKKKKKTSSKKPVNSTKKKKSKKIEEESDDEESEEEIEEEEESDDDEDEDWEF